MSNLAAYFFSSRLAWWLQQPTTCVRQRTLQYRAMLVRRSSFLQPNRWLPPQLSCLWPARSRLTRTHKPWRDCRSVGDVGKDEWFESANRGAISWDTQAGLKKPKTFKTLHCTHCSLFPPPLLSFLSVCHMLLLDLWCTDINICLVGKAHSFFLHLHNNSVCGARGVSRAWNSPWFYPLGLTWHFHPCPTVLLSLGHSMFSSIRHILWSVLFIWDASTWVS